MRYMYVFYPANTVAQLFLLIYFDSLSVYHFDHAIQSGSASKIKAGNSETTRLVTMQSIGHAFNDIEPSAKCRHLQNVKRLKPVEQPGGKRGKVIAGQAPITQDSNKHNGFAEVPHLIIVHEIYTSPKH